MAALSGKPKELVVAYDRADIAGIEVDPGRLGEPVTIAFNDGSAVQVEGAKPTRPQRLREAFAETA